MQTTPAAAAAPLDSPAGRLCVHCTHYREEVDTPDGPVLRSACARPSLPTDLVHGGVLFALCRDERQLRREPFCGLEGRNFERISVAFRINGTVLTLAEFLATRTDDKDVHDWARKARPGDSYPGVVLVDAVNGADQGGAA